MTQEQPPRYTEIGTPPKTTLAQRHIEGPQLHPWTERSDIVKGYAKESWKPSQSVVDLIQNHLDAQEAFWEQKFLQAIGIDPSKKPEIPEEVAQEERTHTLSLAHQWRRFKGTPRGNAAYKELQLLRGEAMPQESILEEKLAHVATVPELHLKVRKKDVDSYLITNVPYDEITKPEWEDYEVCGFYVNDTGSGFDKSFLGGTGDSTKTDNPDRRGGLGEGLKVSTLRLLETGGEVLMVSDLKRGHWVGKAQIGDNEQTHDNLTFTGLAHEQPQNTTHSFTAVDFSESEDLQYFQDVLDPRRGEGLGKYILQFAEKPPTAKGRIYILDLLVEEQVNTLFSYNILDKKAISGRDRSHVDEDVLKAVVKSTVENLADKGKIDQIISEIANPTANGKSASLEVQTLSKVVIAAEYQELWREAVTKLFHFLPNKQVFHAGPLSSNDARLAQERNLSIIYLPSENAGAIHLFRQLFQEKYPNAPITVADLKSPDENAMELSPDLREQVEATKSLFSEWLIKQIDHDPTLAPLIGGKGDNRLQSLTITKSTSTYPPFQYYPDKNELQIADVSKLTRQQQIELLCELTKVAATGKDGNGKYTFDVETQALINSSLATALLARDHSLETFTLPDLGEQPARKAKITYPDTQETQDIVLTSTGKLIETMQSVGISENALTECAVMLRALSGSDLKNMNQPANFKSLLQSFKGYYFFLHGKVVELDPETLEFMPAEIHPLQKDNMLEKTARPNDNFQAKETYALIKERITEKKPEPQTTYTTLSADQPEYAIQRGEHYFIPFDINDNTSKTFTFTDNSGTAQTYTVRRRDNGIQITNNNKAISGQRDVVTVESTKSFGYYDSNLGFINGGASFQVFGNLLYINPHSESFTFSINSENSLDLAPQPSSQESSELKTQIAITYGEMVWNNPIRSILDAIQNAKDAQKGKMPEIRCMVVDTKTFEVQVINYLDLINIQEKGNEEEQNQKVIVGMDIVDFGPGFTPEYLLELGKTSKKDEDIGHFGEGLKMLLLSGLRYGIHMEIASRDWKAIPGKYADGKFDAESGKDRMFEYLKYDLSSTQPRIGTSLSFSAIPGLQEFSLTPGKTTIITDPGMRNEIQKLILLRTGGKSKTWFSWTDVVDPRKKDEKGKQGLERYMVTDSERKIKTPFVTVLLDRESAIFEHGLRITNLEESKEKPAHSGIVQLLNSIPPTVSEFATHPEERDLFGDLILEENHNFDPSLLPTVFGYDIDGRIITTRERNAFDRQLLQVYLSQMIRTTTDVSFMKALLERAKGNSYTEFLEYYLLRQEMDKLNEGQKAAWRNAYYDVFGNNAVLSLKSILDKRIGTRSHKSIIGISSMRDEERMYLETMNRAVRSESDLEAANLVRLPTELSEFFQDLVYTSINHANERDSMPDLEVSPDTKQQAFSLFHRIVDTTIHILEDPANKDFVNTMTTEKTLHTRIDALRALDISNFHIKPIDYPNHGTFMSRGHGLFAFAFNVHTLQNREQLITTVVHELAHLFSQSPDYILPFQKWLMTFAMADPQFQQQLLQ